MKQKCTMQWGNKCDADATHEVRQNFMGKDKDGKTIKLPETYNIALNCEDHVPVKAAAQYVIVEIS